MKYILAATGVSILLLSIDKLFENYDQWSAGILVGLALIFMELCDIHETIKKNKA